MPAKKLTTTRARGTLDISIKALQIITDKNNGWEYLLLSMIGIMEPPIFAVMEPVKRVEKGFLDPPFNQAI